MIPRAATRRTYFALLGLALLARALVVLRPIDDLDGLTIPDDCFYTLDIARSIAHGLGPYTGLAHTNGFQPLIAFLEVPSFWMLHDLRGPVRVAITISALADVAALALFGRLLLRQVRDVRLAWLAMFAWAVSPYSISNATNGLETSLAVCLILAAASYFPRLARADSGPSEFFVFGVLGGLALFARIDAGLLLAVAAVLSARAVLARGMAAALRCGASTAAGVVVTNLPWWLFSYHYTGRVYPDSGRAVRLISHFWVQHPSFTNVYLPELLDGVRTLVSNERPILVLLLAAVVFLTGRGGAEALLAWLGTLWRTQRLLVVFAIILFFAYTTYVFGFWFFYRYFYVISVVVLLATALATDEALTLLEGTRRSTTCYAAAGLFLLVAALRGEEPTIDITSGPRSFSGIYVTADPAHHGWLTAGFWAAHHFPAGTVVASRTSGAIGYAAPELTVVNLDGVVNHDAYEALVGHRLLDYARAAHVQYVLVWDGVDFLRYETASYRDGDLALEGRLDFESLGRPWDVYRLVAR